MQPSSPAIHALVTALYGASMVQREISRCAVAGLGTQGFSALALIDRDGPLRVSDVAERLCIDLSVASRQVAALAEAGHVEREADGGDRRAQRITVTARGREAVAAAHRRMADAFARPLADWPEDDVTALAAALERLREDFAGR